MKSERGRKNTVGQDEVSANDEEHSDDDFESFSQLLKESVLSHSESSSLKPGIFSVHSTPVHTSYVYYCLLLHQTT